jgi:two-component system sensor histidine kinase YesM
MSRFLPKTRKFSTKMILVIVMVILIPMVFTSISFYIVSTTLAKSNVKQSMLQFAKQMGNSMNSIINMGTQSSYLLFSNASIHDILNATNVTFDDTQRNYDFMTSTLNNLVYSSDYIRTIYIFGEKGDSWGSTTFSILRMANNPLEQQEWIENVNEKKGQPLWLPLQYELWGGGKKLVLPVVRMLRNLNDHSNIGYLVVNMDGEVILDTIKQDELGKTGQFFVVNEEGMVMISENLPLVGNALPNKELLHNVMSGQQDEFEFNENDMTYYGVKRALTNGWVMVGVVPESDITGTIDSLRSTIIFSFVFFTLIAVVIGYLMSRRIVKPIKLMTRQMKLVKAGDLSVRTAIMSVDEFGILSREFNHMLIRIEALMGQVINEQNKKQAAEIRAVMHRINPHFLFNTLSMIRWLIKFDHTDKADEAISALIRLLELNMGKKGHFITIEEEIDIVNKYIAILELRYSLKFDLVVTIQEDLKLFEIPRMLFQPLVENAVFHGFVPNSKNGKINIVVTSREGSLEMIVSDNGRGMDENKLNDIRQAFRSDSDDEIGFGLKHLYEAVTMNYGLDSYINIFSSVIGTTFVIVLKK